MYTMFDPLYLYLVLPAVFFALWTQWKVTRNFKKYSRIRTYRGLTGKAAAKQVLDQAGLYNVKIEHVPGSLTDHYDPKSNTIRLSDDVYGRASVAAVGVAAHEAGHAVQHARHYLPVKVRAGIIPATRLGSALSMPLIIMGLIISIPALITWGIIFFGISLVFQLVTLPVEFNASKRAMAALESSGMLTEEELPGSQKVLSAAAMTYVAALAVSLTQFIRLIALSKRRR